MNCEEFRWQISTGNYAAEASGIEHLELCSECRALAHAEEEIRRSLVVVRESAPEIPASLEGTVMAAYRARVAGKSRAASRMRIWRPLAWSAVAASLVLAAILLLWHRKPAISSSVVTVPQKTSAPTVKAEAQRQTPNLAVAPQASIRRAPARVHRHKSNQEPVAVTARNTPENGFQNLMFCDPLSCPGPMQVIRIQVPASAINRVPAWRPTGGMVQADVVVGSDGIARAIRIVR